MERYRREMEEFVNQLRCEREAAVDEYNQTVKTHRSR